MLVRRHSFGYLHLLLDMVWENLFGGKHCRMGTLCNDPGSENAFRVTRAERGRYDMFRFFRTEPLYKHHAILSPLQISLLLATRMSLDPPRGNAQKAGEEIEDLTSHTRSSSRKWAMDSEWASGNGHTQSPLNRSQEGHSVQLSCPDQGARCSCEP